MSNNKDFKVKNGIKPTAYHEAVGTVVSGNIVYNIAAASYDSKFLDTSAQGNTTRHATPSYDGTKMYVLKASGTPSVYQYSLSTPYDASTGSYDSVSFAVNTQDAAPNGILFKPDGTKMYMTGALNTSVFQYSLSTAWDLSTASYDSKSFNTSSQAPVPVSAHITSNGTKMFVVCVTNDTVYQYTLSTAWDVSTASYDSKSFSVAAQDANPQTVRVENSGTEMYIWGSTNDDVFKYSLSTPYDVSTATYVTNKDLAATQTAVYGGDFSSDGFKMYVTNNSNQYIYQYSVGITTNTLDLSTGSVFEITPTSDIQVSLSNPAASGTVSGATLLLDGGVSNSYDISSAVYDNKSLSVNAQEAAPQGMALSSDGTKLYVVGTNTDEVEQYTLSTAWDISTASYDSKNFSVLAQTTASNGVTFKTDGTKMYVCNNRVYEYDLSTAWDVSTATYNSVSLLFGNLDGATRVAKGVTFKPDGTKLYMATADNEKVYQYSLSTPWDVSSGTYDSVSLDISTEDLAVNSIAFSSDGTRMVMVGNGTDAAYQYTLSTAWDLSTASYDSVSLDFTTWALNPSSVAFDTYGIKMYVCFLGDDTVRQYTVGTEATITYDTAIQWAGGTAPTSPATGETDVLTFSTRDGGTTYSAALAIDGAQ